MEGVYKIQTLGTHECIFSNDLEDVTLILWRLPRPTLKFLLLSVAAMVVFLNNRFVYLPGISGLCNHDEISPLSHWFLKSFEQNLRLRAYLASPLLGDIMFSPSLFFVLFASYLFCATQLDFFVSLFAVLNHS